MSVAKSRWALLALTLSAAPVLGASPQSTPKPAVRVMTAMSTPLKSGHPILFLNGSSENTGSPGDSQLTRLEFPADQRYSKWSVIFEAPVRVENVEVSTCEGTKPFSDGVELFLDAHEKRLYADGGRRIVKFNLAKMKTAARALTLNFLESPGLCLEWIHIKTAGEWLKPRTLLMTSGAAGNEVIADGAIGVPPRAVTEGKKAKLMGSRKAGEWKLEWENPLIVERLVVWNGNQNAGDVFNEGARVHELEIRADGSKLPKAALEDRRFYQFVDFKEPRAIHTLELKASSQYSGAREGEPILGEVQLSAGGENWIPVAVAGGAGSGISSEAMQVRERGYGDVLDRELRGNERGEVWKFRLRSDGTFYARVFVDRARVARAWSAIGTWRLQEKIVGKQAEPSPTPGKSFLRAFAKSPSAFEAAQNTPGLSLVLTGTKIVTPDAADSLPCADECFAPSETRGPSEQRELPVFEQIELQRDGRSVFYLRNRTEPQKRTLEFADMKVRIHSLYD